MFQHIDGMKCKLQEIIYFLEVMNSAYDKVVTNKSNCNVFKNNCNYLVFILFPFFGVRMSWNNGGKRNLFLKLKSEIRPYHVVLTTAKTSLKKLNLTVVEMHI